MKNYKRVIIIISIFVVCMSIFFIVVNKSIITNKKNKLKQIHSLKKRTDLIFIPAGEFEMGSNDFKDEEKPTHRVYLDAFFIDKYEVTVEKYVLCVKAGDCEAADKVVWGKKHRSEYDKYCNFNKPDRKKHPIDCVDWENANRYCKFAKKRLPTEAEWEKAATWKNNKKFLYPSGKSKISCKNSIMTEKGAWYKKVSAKYTWNEWKIGGGCEKVGTWEVGSKLIEINGTYDMAGNVWEWTADWFKKYSTKYQKNPKGPSSGSKRVYRGGGWTNGLIEEATALRGTYRGYFVPTDKSFGQGFRCALSP